LRTVIVWLALGKLVLITSPEGSEDEEELPKHGSRSTDAELHQLFQELSISGNKPDVLSLSDKDTSLEVFPTVLKSLHKPFYLQLQYNELLEVCETVFKSLTVIAEMTKSMEKSKLLFKHRAGRITSSLVKAVCHTDPTKPAQSLIKSICYPLELLFCSKETDYGKRKRPEFILQKAKIKT